MICTKCGYPPRKQPPAPGLLVWRFGGLIRYGRSTFVITSAVNLYSSADGRSALTPTERLAKLTIFRERLWCSCSCAVRTEDKVKVMTKFICCRLAAILCRKYRVPFEPRSQAASSVVSTGVRDHLGTQRAASFFSFLLVFFKLFCFLLFSFLCVFFLFLFYMFKAFPLFVGFFKLSPLLCVFLLFAFLCFVWFFWSFFQAFLCFIWFYWSFFPFCWFFWSFFPFNVFFMCVFLLLVFLPLFLIFERALPPYNGPVRQFDRSEFILRIPPVLSLPFDHPSTLQHALILLTPCRFSLLIANCRLDFAVFRSDCTIGRLPHQWNLYTIPHNIVFFMFFFNFFPLYVFFLVWFFLWIASSSFCKHSSFFFLHQGIKL